MFILKIHPEGAMSLMNFVYPIVKPLTIQSRMILRYVLQHMMSNTFVLVILWWVVRKAEETGKYSWSKFCTVNH